MNTVHWLIVSALAATAASVAAMPANPVGWMPDPAYKEVPPDKPRAGFHQLLLLNEEALEDWSERVEIFALPDPGSLSAAQLIDHMAAQLAVHCPKLNDHRIELPAAESQRTAIALWHCPENQDSGRGEVKSVKVIRDADNAFAMVAEGRYPVFSEGSTPLLRVQLKRWSDMQVSFQLCTAYNLPGCLPDPNVLAAAPAADPGPDENEAIRRTEARGLQIFHQDQLAWHATDYARSQGLLNDLKGAGHFLAMPAADGAGSVYFVAERSRRRPRGLRIDIDATGKASTGGIDERLTEEAEQRYRALRAAVSRAEIKLCTPTWNTVVLPHESDEGWLVYVLSASDQQGITFIGGHNRIKVTTRGKVESVEHSANSCVRIDTNDGPQDHEEFTYHVVTHVISDMPWETHLFQSRTLDKPLIVPTAQAVWRVDAGRLQRLALD